MKLRASSLPVLAVCPGFASLPSDKGSSYATDGTAKHSGIAALLMGEPMPADLTSEQASAAGDAVDWLRANITEDAPTGVELAHERELDGVLITGHADVEWPDLIIDHKTGGGQPFMLPRIEDDLQMRAYGWLVGEGGPIVVARFLTEPQRLDILDLDEDEAKANEDRLLKVVRFVKANEGVFVPGPHCTACFGRHRCTQYQDGAHQLVPMGHLEVALTDDTAGQLAVALGAAETLCARVKDLLKDHVRNGGTVAKDGQVWSPKTVKTDRVVDAQQVIDHLSYLLDNAPPTKLTMTKGDLVKALKREGIPVDETLDALREAGAISTSESERWAWGKGL